MKATRNAAFAAAALGVLCLAAMPADAQDGLQKWTKGKGWGWVWGKDDEVGALNAMTDASRQAALQLVKQGKVYDLGVPYDRDSFKWPGHSPGEIMTFRTPEGVKRQGDFAVATAESGNTGHTRWHSCALFINDNVATQIDGLGHITAGDDNHWYNGFKEADWGGNFGIRKCDATTIPPIITRGVLHRRRRLPQGRRAAVALRDHRRGPGRHARDSRRSTSRPGDTSC